MSFRAVIGAGPIGSATAMLLAVRGEQVRIISRRGSGPDHARVERVAADATDQHAVSKLVFGATTVFSCAAPPYWRWPAEFPPLGRSILEATAKAETSLVMLSNLYAYGPVDGPITESHPLAAATVKGRVRAQLWEEALAAHEAGRVRACEIRASDFIGPGALSILTEMVVTPIVAGHRVLIPANLDAPHTWTYTLDTARTLVAAADHDRSWGRAWHVPSAPPESVRKIAAATAALVAGSAPRLTALPGLALLVGGAFASVRGDGAKFARELREVGYQREHAWVLDSTAAETTFGLTPTTLEESLSATVKALRGERPTSTGGLTAGTAS